MQFLLSKASGTMFAQVVQRKNYLTNLEFKIFGNITENVDKKKKRKCRYYNKSYCKNESECEFYPSEKICKNFLAVQKCPDMGCSEKHPVSCKFWLRDSRRCF